jgi:nucleoside-diphosphate-sugar epimerase
MDNLPKVLIVGINSFLAKAIYTRLKDNYEVIGVYHQNITNVPGDTTLLGINELFKLDGSQIKYVFIVSAFVPYVKGSDDTCKLFDANVMLPQKICDHFKSSRIILCSSVSVYEGLDNTADINETTNVSPLSTYGISKLWGEQVVKSHASYAILRISSMYGEGMKETTFIPKIIANALTTQNINLLGAGERLQNYIHVNDVAQMTVSLALIEANGVFLGTANKSYSNLEVAQIVQHYTGCTISFSGSDDSPSYTYNNTNTTSRIKKAEFVEIAEGINQIIEWKKKQF